MVSGRTSKWDAASLASYYEAFHKHGTDWVQVRSQLARARVHLTSRLVHRLEIADGPGGPRPSRDSRPIHPHHHLCAQVASACGPGKSAEQCEGLYKQHATFLSLAHSTALAAAFVAMVQVGLGPHEGLGRMRVEEPAA